MKRVYWRRCATWAAGILATLGMSSVTFAQESVEQRLQRLEKQNDEFRKNAEALQKQNEMLLKLLSGPGASPVSTPGAAPLAADEIRNIVNGYLQEKEAKKAAENPAAAADGRYKIGSDLKMSATWKNGFIAKTTNDDFSLHVGGWLQYDNLWWDQSRSLRVGPGARPGAAQGVGFGVAGGGIGILEDGTDFRRVRIMTDGKFWENYE